MTDAWEQFRTAYSNIEKDMVGGHAPSERQMNVNDGLQMALTELEDAFRHVHVRSDNFDICAKCGLDLRNDIHVRVRR